MTTMQTKESVCESLARTAWLLSGHVGTEDITGTAIEIAKQSGGDWGDIRDGIVAGLKSLSEGDERYWETPGNTGEYAGMGHVSLGDWDCYWWSNNGESNWSSDQPEWWDDQIAQWSDNDGQDS